MKINWCRVRPGICATICVLVLAALLLSGAQSGDSGRAGGVPVGTICAFVGQKEPSGWIPCDGRLLSQEGTYKALFDTIGHRWCDNKEIETLKNEKRFRVPDLKGMFLRGAGQNAQYSYAGGDERAVGSFQNCATAFPKEVPFTVSENPGLSVSARIPNPGDLWKDPRQCAGWICGSAWWDKETRTPGGTDKHDHSISGGDGETRPANAAVNWIIRFAN